MRRNVVEEKTRGSIIMPWNQSMVTPSTNTVSLMPGPAKGSYRRDGREFTVYDGWMVVGTSPEI